MAVMLPTLLEGELLATWMELSSEEQGDYITTNKTMIERMISFVYKDQILKC